jgi:hypothetical protein
VQKNWPFWLPKLNCFTSTVAKNSLDPKTQPQNTHRNQNEPTTTLSSTGFALSTRQHMPQTQLLVPLIPIDQQQERGIGFALSAIGSIVWGAFKRHQRLSYG